jgi:hypothetical protein
MGWYFEESPRARDAVGIKRSRVKITDSPFLSTDFHNFVARNRKSSDWRSIKEDRHSCLSFVSGGPSLFFLRRTGIPASRSPREAHRSLMGRVRRNTPAASLPSPIEGKERPQSGTAGQTRMSILLSAGSGEDPPQTPHFQKNY